MCGYRRSNNSRTKYFLFFFFSSIADTHIYRYMINEFIYKNIKMSGSVFYMKSHEALYKKLNVLGETCFDLITFCQDERIDLRNVLDWLFIPQLWGFWERFGSFLQIIYLFHILGNLFKTNLIAQEYHLQQHTPIKSKLIYNFIFLCVECENSMVFSGLRKVARWFYITVIISAAEIQPTFVTFI